MYSFLDQVIYIYMYIYVCVCVCVCVCVYVWNTCRVAAQVVKSEIVVSVFKNLLSYYIHFRTNII